MRIADFVFGSTVDGSGVRNVVFVQGCRHRCAGCHNPQTHSFSAGKSMTEERVVETLVSNWTAGGKPAITVSGGDPFYQPTSLAEICAMLKNRYGADIWVYTGFTWEQLRARYEVLKNVDVLVDGPFVQGLRTLETPYVGSSNQRVVDAKRSLASGKVVLWHDPEVPELDLIRRALG